MSELLEWRSSLNFSRILQNLLIILRFPRSKTKLTVYQALDIIQNGLGLAIGNLRNLGNLRILETFRYQKPKEPEQPAKSQKPQKHDKHQKPENFEKPDNSET